MKISTKLIAIILSLIFIPPYVMAQDTSEDKLAEVLASYQKTGNVENCISTRNISRTIVIDDQHIIFKRIGRKLYLNTLPHACPSLGFEKSFSYKTSSSRLCSQDIINVFVNGAAMSGPSCGLGKFEEYEKISDDTEEEEEE